MHHLKDAVLAGQGFRQLVACGDDVRVLHGNRRLGLVYPWFVGTARGVKIVAARVLGVDRARTAIVVGAVERVLVKARLGWDAVAANAVGVADEEIPRAPEIDVDRVTAVATQRCRRQREPGGYSHSSILSQVYMCFVRLRCAVRFGACCWRKGEGEAGLHSFKTQQPPFPRPGGTQTQLPV